MTKPLVAALLLLLASCDDTPGKWSSIVYPDAHDRSKWLRTDRFKTEEMCQQNAAAQVAALPEPKKAAYECVEGSGPG
jgi:hypothetical protein